MKERLGSGVKAIGEWVERGWESKWAKAERGYLRSYGVITGIGIIAASIVGWWLNSQDWTGFHGRKYGDAKTLWDWLDLLVVPIVLAIGAYVFDRRAKNRDQAREEAARERDKAWEDSNRQEEILQDYLDDMSQLLMDKKLKAALKKRHNSTKAKANEQGGEERGETKPEADEESPVVDVARARTVSTLRRLNTPQRRKELLDFLRDAGLYNGETPLLKGAKMDGINLKGTGLSEIDLSGASLIKADLAEANLWEANLGGAFLIWANLTGANLMGAHLRAAKSIPKTEGWKARRAGYIHMRMIQFMPNFFDQANPAEINILGTIGIEEVRFDKETTLPDGTKWHEGVDWTQWTEPKKPKEDKKKEE